MKKIWLKSGRQRSVLNHHPWIFSGAIKREDDIESGETVDVMDDSGQWLARASYSPVSSIRARIWTWNEDEQINADFFLRKIKSAVDYRTRFIPVENQNAYRLVHAESDGIPGLIADVYHEVLVLQFLTAGVEAWRETIINCFTELDLWKSIYERSDADVRQLEGLQIRNGLISGKPIDGLVEIIENDLKYAVDIENGHKTGFYLDQVQNRLLLGKHVEKAKVLNCFSYTGGFSVSAFAGGAGKVISVDSSQSVLEIAKHNVERNGFTVTEEDYVCADVFQYLRKLRDQAEQFDVIVLDPPKFAPTAAQVKKAARGYKDINLLAMKLLNPGGLLFTFSCSGGLSMDLFKKIVSDAALDAGVAARIVQELHQGPDHPILMSFPEGTYLKGLFLQISNDVD